MDEDYMRYREIVESRNFNSTAPEVRAEIIVPTGASSVSQKDVKFPDAAGGYTYLNSDRLTDFFTRNRFLYWQGSNEKLEIGEVSFDFNLKDDVLRLSFEDAVLVGGSGSVGVHSGNGEMVVLVATTASVHRFCFPHPIELDEDNAGNRSPSVSSIFTDAAVERILDPANTHTISSTGGGVIPTVHAAATFLTQDEAVFALATSTGSILVISMPQLGRQGVVTQHEIKQPVMSRLWGGLTMMRGSQQDSGFITSSLCMLSVHDGKDLLIFAVCKDHKVRVWSAKKYEFILAVDLLEHVPDGAEFGKTIGGYNHIVKRSVPHGRFIVVFMMLPSKNQFCIYDVDPRAPKPELTHSSTLFTRENNLIDFYVTNMHLWTLTAGPAGETVVKYISLHRTGHGNLNWIDVITTGAEKNDLDTSSALDPREVYMDHIFYPGRFSVQLILKALNIFRRSTYVAKMSDYTIPLPVLKTEVCEAVRAEIQRAASEYEMGEEEFIQLQSRQWSRFYSCCVQYQQRETKALGLFMDTATGLVCLVKKSCLSYLRTCETLEQLYLSPLDSANMESLLFSQSLIGEDRQLCRDVVQLCECVRLTRQMINEDEAYCYEQNLYHLSNPIQLSSSHVKLVFSEQRESAVLKELGRRVQSNAGSYLRATEYLIQLLDIGLNQPPENADTHENNRAYTSRYEFIDSLFSSAAGVNAICQTVRQQAQCRLELCRDLLIFLRILYNIGNERVPNELMTHLSVLVRSYFFMKWCTHSVAAPLCSSITIENNQKKLESLNLPRASYNAALINSGDQARTLLELFLQTDGSGVIRNWLVSSGVIGEDGHQMVWNDILPAISATVLRLLWPTLPGFSFPLCLVVQCQYQAVQQYVRLTRWCDQDSSSRSFILALSYLHSNEPCKALECFLGARQGVLTEEFLMNVMSKVVNDLQHIDVLYFLQVIELFEQEELSELVVTLAMTAKGVVDVDDPYLPTLWSKIFKHELEMHHTDMAYSAMLSNPDPERRKNCLRQFIVVLCERNELSKLVELTYRDKNVILESEVVNILESRARCVDLMKHNYYDLLYAFHINRNNYRKAAAVMYEHAQRLGTEVPGLKGVQHQAKCYLACLNALRLGDPQFAWIVKPVATTTAQNKDVSTDSHQTLLGKRLNMKAPVECVRRVDVLDVTALRKEYALIHAHLLLLGRSTAVTAILAARPGYRADETVGLLVNAGLFDEAVQVCRLFECPLTPIFEGLAIRCIQLSENISASAMIVDNDYTTEAWTWLDANQLSTPSAAHEPNTASDVAWRLLRTYLLKYEQERSTRYHRVVALKMLTRRFPLTSWLVASYKKLNGAELLRLYLDYDRLEEAAQLAIEYLQATLGKGKEYFGLQDYLHAGANPVWIPYTSMDQLKEALTDVSSEPRYKQLLRSLVDVLEEYLHVARTASNDTHSHMLSRSASLHR